MAFFATTLRLPLIITLLMLTGCAELLEKPPAEQPSDPEKPDVTGSVCPEPEPCICPVCPKQKVVKVPVLNEKKVVGEVENVTLMPDNLVYPARIDTGATTTSIHATDITRFERDGERWVRYTLNDPKTGEPLVKESKQVRRIRIKNAEEGFDRRRVVMKTLILGDISRQIEVSLIDRSGLEYPLLIGRNFLVDLMIVDVSQRNVGNMVTSDAP